MAKRTRKRRPKRSSRALPRQDQRLRQQVRDLYPPGGGEEDWGDDLDAAPEGSGRSAEPRPEPAAEAQPRETDARRGTVVTLLSGTCHAECEGRRYRCVLPSRLARDQQSTVAVGDEVDFVPHGKSHRVAGVLPRRTVLSRPDPHNPRLERVVAANVDVVVQVASVAKPPLRISLVDRYLIAIERGGAEPCLCVNKTDLLSREALAQELAKLEDYRRMGLTVVTCSAKTGAGVEGLRQILAGRTAVFVGHSGVGKSSLLKALDPDLKVATSEVSRRYARGRHTTSRSHLYKLDGDVRLIDTPGIRELGLWQMSAAELKFYFPEFNEAASGCRFNNCTHSHEPDCAVRSAVDAGNLSKARYATYLRILRSLAEEL